VSPTFRWKHLVFFVCFLSVQTWTVQRKKKVKKKKPLDFLFRSILTRTLNNRQDENPHTILHVPNQDPNSKRMKEIEENGGKWRKSKISSFLFHFSSFFFFKPPEKTLKNPFLLPEDQSQYDVIHSWCCRKKKKTETLIFFFLLGFGEKKSQDLKSCSILPHLSKPKITSSELQFFVGRRLRHHVCAVVLGER